MFVRILEDFDHGTTAWIPEIGLGSHKIKMGIFACPDKTQKH
jgi:hypothetical protein